MFPVDREAGDCLTCEVPVLTNASPPQLQKSYPMNFFTSAIISVKRDEGRAEK